jgi:hypothetical protein
MDDEDGGAPFLRHLYVKVILLPRQARDKHRESTQKRRARTHPIARVIAEGVVPVVSHRSGHQD